MIVPPIPGGFSALGLVATDFRRDYVKTFYARLDGRALRATSPRPTRAMEAEARRDAARAPACPRRAGSWRARPTAATARQAYELTVPVARGAVDARDARRAWPPTSTTAIAQTYGHASPGRAGPVREPAPVAAGGSSRLDVSRRRDRTRRGSARDGGARGRTSRRPALVRCDVLAARGAGAGRRAAPGPLIVESPGHAPSSSRPAGTAASRPAGLTVAGDEPTTALTTDPATFEVVKNALYCAAEEMKVVLAKTAYSPLLKVAGDYSCGLFDVRGEMVAQGPDLPIHLGSMPLAVKAVIPPPPTFEPGDVFIHNDPYFGGSHLPDVNVVTPGLPRGHAARLRLRAGALAGHRQRYARLLRRHHRDLR